jgi:hypothetical protein
LLGLPGRAYYLLAYLVLGSWLVAPSWYAYFSQKQIDDYGLN